MQVRREKRTSFAPFSIYDFDVFHQVFGDHFYLLICWLVFDLLIFFFLIYLLSHMKILNSLSFLLSHTKWWQKSTFKEKKIKEKGLLGEPTRQGNLSMFLVWLCDVGIWGSLLFIDWLISFYYLLIKPHGDSSFPVFFFFLSHIKRWQKSTFKGKK